MKEININNLVEAYNRAITKISVMLELNIGTKSGSSDGFTGAASQVEAIASVANALEHQINNYYFRARKNNNYGIVGHGSAYDTGIPTGAVDNLEGRQL